MPIIRYLCGNFYNDMLIAAKKPLRYYAFAGILLPVNYYIPD